VLDKDGNQVYVRTPAGDVAAAYTFDASNAARALKLIGDHISVACYGTNAVTTQSPSAPEDTEWTLKIVHMTKAEFDAGKGNGKPAIEHRP